jgi:iron complex transport system substrate-binding protein
MARFAAPAVAAALLATTGCQRHTPPTSAGPAPRRIVSLAPSATEILFAVGAGPRVAAVDSFSNYPPEAKRLPKVGGISVNYEAVVAARPDLVVGVSDLQAASLERCRQLGLKTLALDTTTLAKTIEAIRTAGAATGNAAEGWRAARALESALLRVSRSVAHRPRVKTLFVAEATPSCVVAGHNTFIDEVIRAAGGENATDATGFATLGREAQKETAPDVVLAGDETEAKALRRVWPYPARVVVAPRDILVRPGPRLAVGVRWLAQTLHPEVRVP